MSKKPNSSLRPPVRPPDDLNRFRRFLADNVRPSNLPAELDDDGGPSRDPVVLADLHRQPGPGDPDVEQHSATMRPMMRRRYAPEVAGSPGPFVTTSVPQSFTAAGSGKQVTPGPRPHVTSADIIEGSR